MVKKTKDLMDKCENQLEKSKILPAKCDVGFFEF